MPYSSILVHYAEVALKGKNRPQFIKRLRRNVRCALSGLPVAEVRKVPGRLWVTAHGGESFDDTALQRLGYVYGVSSYSPVVKTALEMEAMKAAALELVTDRAYESFRVSARRAFKDLPFTSLEVNRDLGAHLLAHRPAAVKMKGADLELHVEMLPGGAYLYVDKIPGLGGLPVGITGTVCALLSGGIDSPVAAFRLMRRGCRVIFVHFHAHPFVTKASLEKAQDLAEHLVRYQNNAILYAVPFGELQSKIVEKIGPPLRVVLYRRFMMRIAAQLGLEHGAKALVTGESLAQVASQTLTNLVTIDAASPMPILRPVVALDKQEIIDQAKGLGTYETSIQPDQDCCQLFVPKHPETHARRDAVEAAEADLEVEALVADAVARAERSEINAPWWQPRPHRGHPEDDANEPAPEAARG